jgi:hypothetical protein
MNIRKYMTGLAAAAAIFATSAVPSMAQSSTFASATTLFSVFSYTPSATGGITVTSGGATKFTSTAQPNLSNTGDTLSFTGLQNIGAVYTLDNVFYNQALTGGTFTLKNGATTLLSGTFAEGILGGFVADNNKDANISFLNVTYTGGTYWTTAEHVLDFSNPGALSVALLSTRNLAVAKNGAGILRFVSFGASGTGTFGAEELTPEPAAVLPFLFGALGLAALVLRKRRFLGANGAIG